MPATCPFCRADHRPPSGRGGCAHCGRSPGPRAFLRSSSIHSAPPRVAVLSAGRDPADTPLPSDPGSGVFANVLLPTPASPGSCPSLPGDEYAAQLPPSAVPGYRIEKVLGHGGMGTVYLAKQLSLDRLVALKVMGRKWATDPVFVARFTREAFAAALLSHPNVVPIYDIGDADGVRFFSMEYVPGRSLADLVKSDGRLAPETAVGFVLQAARGLKHAHDRGLIHRDVKPDNLLLNDQGMVKVADLGLVKTSDDPHPADHPTDPSESGLHTLPVDMTGARMALGTPAYMAPEQCRDAAAVDLRADIYSLGCTLYVMVTGKPPFEGKTAADLMTQHAYAPLVPPEELSSRVPKELSAVIQKMMAKEPDDRFQNMGEVVRTLEGWLGLPPTGTFAPRDDQVETVERAADRFHDSPAAVRRARLAVGGVAACLLGAVLFAAFGRLGWAFGAAAMVVQAALAYFILNGVTRRTYLFSRVRHFGNGMSGGDWAVAAAGFGLFCVALWTLGLFWTWVGFGLLGIGAAFVFRFAADRAVDRDRREPLARCERLLMLMRREGVDEDDVRQFVAKAGGRHWEELFEALFGFEAKLAARVVLLRAGSAGPREKFAAWREPVAGFIDRVDQSRREARQRRLLERVEAARLAAAGVTGRAGRERAAAAAAAMVDQANAYRSAADRKSTSGPTLRELLLQSHEPIPFDAPERPVDRLARLGLTVVGSAVRAVLAAVLLAGGLLWAHQNGLFARVAGPPAEVVPGPLVIGWLPPAATDWIDSANVGWAGILLLASLFYRGNRCGALALVGAGVAAAGHRFGLQAVEALGASHVALMFGTALAMLGFRLGRPA